MKMNVIVVLAFILIAPYLNAAPILQMHKAFNALSELLPYLTNRDMFMDNKNSAFIEKNISELQTAFKSAGHDKMIKGDLFAPSYTMINENLNSTLTAFKKGKKDYAHWRLKEISSNCLDCHTRLPSSHTSSFQDGEFSIDRSKFKDAYNLGIAQLIVRRYVDAKTSFMQSFNERVIKKEYKNIILPIKQLLLIDTKVLKNPDNLISTFKKYSERKDLPDEVKTSLLSWNKRLGHWKGNKFLKNGLTNDADVETFIKNELSLLKGSDLKEDHDVDLLFASGMLSNYLFENTETKKAPEISYWLGWSEKHLRREDYFGSGDLFLKQCIRRYPAHPVAKECLKEYKESVEFEFSGSGGTNIPEDVSKELDELTKLVKHK